MVTHPSASDMVVFDGTPYYFEKKTKYKHQESLSISSDIFRSLKSLDGLQKIRVFERFWNLHDNPQKPLEKEGEEERGMWGLGLSRARGVTTVPHSPN